MAGGPYLATEGVVGGPFPVKVEVVGVPCQAVGEGVGAYLEHKEVEEGAAGLPSVLVVEVEEGEVGGRCWVNLGVKVVAVAVVVEAGEVERHIVVSEETFEFCLAFQ